MVFLIILIPTIYRSTWLLFEPTSYTGYSISTSIYHVVMSVSWIGIVFFILYKNKESGKKMGLHKDMWGREMILGILLFAATRYAFYMYSQIFTPAYQNTGYQATLRPSVLEIIFLVPSLAISAFSEEILMRGYFITRLEGILKNRFAALLVSSLLFASYHTYQGIYATGFIFLFGMLLGVFFQLTRSLVSVTTAHFVYNLYALNIL